MSELLAALPDDIGRGPCGLPRCVSHWTC